MPITKKNIRKPSKRAKLDTSKVVVVTHTTEKATLFPKKLKLANEMLANTKLLK